MDVVILPGASDAELFTARLIAAQVKAKPDAVLGLATGATQEAVYARLAEMCARGEVDFSRISSFNLDEYAGLDGNDRNSYRYYMNHHLFDHVNIRKEATRLPDGTAADPEAECAAYERDIRAAGGVDLQLLGLGNDGHIGFNEPMSSFRSRTRLVVLSPETLRQNGGYFDPPESMPHCAFTMGIGTVMDARKVVMLVTGARKAAVTAAALEGPVSAMVPASALQMHADAVTVLDEAAASQLKLREYYRAAFAEDPRWRNLR